MKLAWKKLYEQDDFITLSVFTTSCVHIFRVVRGFLCKQKEMGYIVENFLWCPSTAFTPPTLVSFAYRWIVHHYMGTYFWSCFVFLALFWPEYSCIHVHSFNKNNRKYSPPKINYSLVLWNHNKHIKISSANLEGAFCFLDECCMH